MLPLRTLATLKSAKLPAAASKQDLLDLAEIAKQAERYDELLQIMNAVIEIGDELSDDERNLFSIAYKNAVTVRRDAWKVFHSAEEMTVGSEMQKRIAREYKHKIEQELTKLCNDNLDLLDRYLIPTASTPASRAYYLKKKGDHLRYLTKIATEELQPTLIEESHKAYHNGFEIAKEQLPSTNPIRLAIALNYSMFVYDIMNDPDKACQLARQSLDDAVTELNKIFKGFMETTNMMVLIIDNLTEWTIPKETTRQCTQDDKPQGGGDN